MEAALLAPIKKQLSERRERLLAADKHIPGSAPLFDLLKQVDAALERIDNGTYGFCEVCNGPIEPHRLIADPLLTVCLDDLSPQQQKALELDLTFASKIQRNLLPQNNIQFSGWEFSYYYNPAGPVSGDFCDIIKMPDGCLFFILGDVSGKGVAASLMMTHLHASIRSLLSFGLSVCEMVEKTNRLFSESTMDSNYATMVLGKVYPSGEIEICNAGHNPPLILSSGKLKQINATGIPIGLFYETKYSINKYELLKDDSILLYTDGLTEASSDGTEYGEERVKTLFVKDGRQSANLLIDSFLKDNAEFVKNSSPADDLTIMVIKKL
jgi:sigma-B regulation protein RsbU (phosphoserine phosphatase)